MKDPTEILTTIASRVLEAKSTDRGGPWSFRDGVRLFINPEARCPDCEGWFPTKRVWLVDEPWNRLLNCWHMDGREIDRTKGEIVHPHVSGRGICMGNNSEASTALFASLSPGKHYFNTERWFWQLGHDCPKVEKDICSICSRKYPIGTGYSYGEQGRKLCSMNCRTIALWFRCWSCGGERPFYESEGNNRGRYCESCYLEKTIACGFCEGRIYRRYPYSTLPTGEIVCGACRPNHYDDCGSCRGEFLRMDLNGDRLCERCENEIEEREEEREEEEEVSPPDNYPCSCYCRCRNRVYEEGTRCADCPPPDVEEEHEVTSE